jgi:putative peptidoglycan lipid II flippase
LNYLWPYSGQQSAEPEAFQETLVWAVKVVFLIGVPASIALVVLSESLITTLFYQGELTQRDVQMAGASLAAYGLGLLGHMLVKVLAPGYFSRQDTKTPVRFGIITLIANMVLNLCLVWHFQHVGLALATSLAAFLNAGLLWMGLVRTGHFRLPDGWWKFVMRLCIANGLMLWFLLWCLPDQTGWFAMAFWQRLGWMLTICVGGAVVYGATLLASGMRLKELMK